MFIYRVQVSQTLSYHLGCNAFLLDLLFVSNLPIRPRSLSSPICTSSVKLLGIQVLLQIDAKFFSKRFKIAQVFVVLALVFDFSFDTCVLDVSVLESRRPK